MVTLSDGAAPAPGSRRNPEIPSAAASPMPPVTTHRLLRVLPAEADSACSGPLLGMSLLCRCVCDHGGRQRGQWGT
jgi:hypothetical protein